MAYWLYRKQEAANSVDLLFQKKVVLRNGDRNNFCILL